MFSVVAFSCEPVHFRFLCSEMEGPDQLCNQIFLYCSTDGPSIQMWLTICLKKKKLMQLLYQENIQAAIHQYAFL